MATDPQLSLIHHKYHPGTSCVKDTGAIYIFHEIAPPTTPTSPHMDTDSDTDEYATAEAFLKTRHSLRQLLLVPLPTPRQATAATVAAAPPAGGQVGGQAGGQASAAVPRVATPSPPPLRVPMEVNKAARYDEVVQRLGDSIGQYVPLCACCTAAQTAAFLVHWTLLHSQPQPVHSPPHRSRAGPPSGMLTSSPLCRDPACIRLTLKSPYTGLPARRPVEHGSDFVATYCPAYSSLYEIFYEVLDMPLIEVEKLKTVRVMLVKANLEVVRPIIVRLTPESLVKDLLAKVRHWLTALVRGRSSTPQKYPVSWMWHPTNRIVCGSLLPATGAHGLPCQ